MKIASIITGGDLHNRRGLLNAALSRIEHLERLRGQQIDVFIINAEYELFSLKSIILGGLRYQTEFCDGREIRIIKRIEYKSNSPLIRKALTAYYLFTKRRLKDWRWQKDIAKQLKNYDVIFAHSNDAAIAATEANRRYSIPFFVTWHGSDIHTTPFIDSEAKTVTIEAIRKAKCNFFVSKALLEESNKLTAEGKKDVLYNGVDDCFKRFDEETRESLKRELGVENKKVISFAGNLRSIKNANILPDIFNKVTSLYKNGVVFWIIGDGELHTEIEHKLNKYEISCKMLGSIPHSEMPKYFNCTDVLVLPSRNEGLPLVTLEALSCGANVIGSKVGGIPEAIGESFCVPIGKTFIDEFANKVVELLNNPTEQPFIAEFNWDYSASKENEHLESI